MITLTKKENCCGCNACGDVCPVNAITFANDSEGFWYPEIDKSKCINCGLCETTCPIVNAEKLKENDFAEPKCFAAVHKSMDVVFASTSGGVFSALADAMYKKGGYVGGAVHNDDFSVSHFISNNRQDLSQLRRSKDLQSNAVGFYKRVKELLENGESVLVCGLPCQMAALRAFLKKDFDNLIIVDLACLGVNSPKVWRKYLDGVEKKYGSKIVCTENKSKEYGWRKLTQKFVFENGDEAFDTVSTSPFIKGYVNTHMYCRPSCYDCKFKGFPRIADITIGDFWGVEKYLKNMDDDLGTSFVLVNSAKGEKFFGPVVKRLNAKEIPLSWIVSGNPALKTSISKIVSDEERRKFFERLDKEDFEELINSYEDKRLHSKLESIKNRLRSVKGHLKYLKKIFKITRMHPKALFQTFKYSGLKNIWNGKGLICGTYCTVNIAKSASLSFEGALVLGEKARFPKSKVETRLLVAENAKLCVLGDMSFAYGCDIEVFEGAELILHGNKYSISDTNIGCTIICGEKIEIMNDVGLGRNVLIRDNNGKHFMNTTGYRDCRPVLIGEKAWLCESSVIMPGVKVGRGAVIGAFSLVTHSVPDHCLVSGSPAEIVEKNVLWKR